MIKMWYSLVEVRPSEGNEDFEKGDVGAFVNAVGRAADQDEFVSLLEHALEEQSMELVHIDELELLERRAGWQASDQLRYLSSFVTDRQPVVLGDRYIFEDDSDEP